MTEPVLHPELVSRVRLSRFLVPTLVASAALLAGVIAMRSGRSHTASPACTMAPVVAPVATASTPSSQPEPDPDPPRVRSPVPLLEAECLLPDMTKRCDRDDGLPAISGDGKTIVVKHYEVDGASDAYGLTLHFVDVKTSRVVQFETLVPIGEYPRVSTEENDALLATVAKRAATLQRMLDDRAYRSLQPLGRLDTYRLGGPPFDDTVDSDTTSIHAEFDRAIVTIVDPQTHSNLGRLDFTEKEPRGRDPEGLCTGWELRSVDIAWDPSTRIVLGTTEYDAGGCMCSTYEFSRARRLPPRRLGETGPRSSTITE
jgi:hypothetical protein